MWQAISESENDSGNVDVDRENKLDASLCEELTSVEVEGQCPEGRLTDCQRILTPLAETEKELILKVQSGYMKVVALIKFSHLRADFLCFIMLKKSLAHFFPFGL